MPLKSNVKRLDLIEQTQNNLKRWKDKVTFAKEVLGFQIGHHHLAMEQAIKEHDKVLILLAPGHGKSWWISYLTPLHEMLHNSDLRICQLTKSGTRAVDFNQQISEALLYNENLRIYKDIVPDAVKTRWNSHAIVLNRKTNHKEPTLTTLGYGGQIEGLRLDLIIMDDVIDEEVARSAVESHNAKERFLRIVERRLEPNGRIIIVGTPFSPTDLYGYIRSERKDYHVVELPAIINGKALWEERMPLTMLDKIKAAIPAHIWMQAYMLQAVTTELCRFKWEWLEEKVADEIHPHAQFYAAWDLAIGTKATSDYTAGVIGAVHNGKLIIVDMFAQQIAQDHGVIAHRYANRYNCVNTFIESNNFQQYAVHEFARLTPRKLATGISNMKQKEKRLLDGLEVFFRRGDILISRNLLNTREYNLLKFEYCGYPLVKDDHILDALEMLVRSTISMYSGIEGGTTVESAPPIENYISGFDGTEIGR